MSLREQLEKKYGSPSTRDKLKQKYGETKPVESTGFLDNVKNDLLGRAKSIKDTWVDTAKGKINPLETGLQTVGSIAGGIGDVIGEGISSAAKTAYNYAPNSVKSTVESVSKTALQSDLGREGLRMASAGIDSYNKWKASNPQTAKDLESVINVASMFPIGKGAKVAAGGVEVAGKVAGTAAKATGKAVGNAGKFATAQTSGLSMKTIETIIKNPKALTEAEKAGLDAVKLGTKVKSALDSRVADLRSTGKAYEAIRRSDEKVFLNPGEIGKILEDYGIGITETASKNTPGKSTFKLALNEESVPMKPGDVKELESFLNTYGNKSTLSGNAFMNARTTLTNLKAIGLGSDKSDVSKVIATRLRQYYDQTGKNQLTGLEKLDSIYGPEKAALNKIKKEYLTPDGQLKDGALSRISNATNDGREPVLKRLETLVPGISEDINMYKALKDIEAVKSQKVGAYAANAMRSGVGGFAISGGNPIVAVAGMIASAPQVVVPMLKTYGKLRGVSEKAVDNLILKMKSGKALIDKEKAFINKSIVNAADKFNNTKAAKYVQNIKPGLSLEDVSKNIDPLINEAKKYKSESAYREALKKEVSKKFGIENPSDKAVEDWFTAKQKGIIGGPQKDLVDATLNGEITGWKSAKNASQDLIDSHFGKNSGEVVTVYRGVNPKETSIINRQLYRGDFVTGKEEYASIYGKVQKYTINKSDLIMAPDGKELLVANNNNPTQKIQSITDIWNKANNK